MKLFENWMQQQFRPQVQLEELEKRTFDYHDMLEAFEEGYHLSKDEARMQIQEIFNFWLERFDLPEEEISGTQGGAAVEGFKQSDAI